MMWFKNLRIYRLTQAIAHTPEELSEALAQHEFQPCGKLDPVKYGWVPPLGRHGSEFVHAANGNIMLCAKRQEKIIPSALIKEELENKVLHIQDEEGRFVSRAEKDNLKDEIIFTLLPKALAKSSLDFGYIDTLNSLLIVNTSSAKRAEDFISALRETLGSLKVIPLVPVNPPPQVMTGWVREGVIGDKFVLGEECELQATKEGRVIRCKKQDLTATEIQNHLESGMVVTKLAITWNEAISCIIDDQFSVKRVKYEDAVQEKLQDHHAETAAEQFDMDFSIMTVELAAFIKALCAVFGGTQDAAEDDVPFVLDEKESEPA